MVNGGESFWSCVYAPFMARDLTRDDLRTVVRKGLERTSGNYKVMVDFGPAGRGHEGRALNEEVGWLHGRR